MKAKLSATFSPSMEDLRSASQQLRDYGSVLTALSPKDATLKRDLIWFEGQNAELSQSAPPYSGPFPAKPPQPSEPASRINVLLCALNGRAKGLISHSPRQTAK
jgi:hypothetical protein